MINDSNIEVYIEVSDDDGKTWTKAEELKVEGLPDNVKGKSCYLEVETGQRFRFATTKGIYRYSQDVDVKVLYFCDGQRIGGRVWESKHRAKHRDLSHVEGVYTGACSMRPLLFDTIRTTDDKTSSTLANAEVLGELKVEFWRAECVGEICDAAGTHVPSSGLYHEQQVKKKSSHSVQYAKAVATAKESSIHTTNLDMAPFYTYIFRYQSSALLDINGIRPMTFENSEGEDEEVPAIRSVAGPTGNGSATPRVKKEKRSRTSSATSGQVINIDDDDNDDASELARLRAENARLRKKVKRESKQGPGEVIDLSFE